MTHAEQFNFENRSELLQSKNLFSAQIRVATDLENLELSRNLKEASKSQGICLKSQGICNRIPKVREKSGNFVV